MKIGIIHFNARVAQESQLFEINYHTSENYPYYISKQSAMFPFSEGKV